MPDEVRPADHNTCAKCRPERWRGWRERANLGGKDRKEMETPSVVDSDGGRDIEAGASGWAVHAAREPDRLAVQRVRRYGVVVVVDGRRAADRRIERGVGP